MNYEQSVVRRRRIISPSGAFFAAPPPSAPTGVVWTATDNPAAQAGPSSAVTFTSAALGPAGTRLTVVVVGAQGPAATSVTVGGLSATKAVEESGALNALQIWYVDTSSLGTTANIVVASGSNMNAIIV